MSVVLGCVPCAVLSVVVMVFALNGMLGFIPGGRVVQFAAALGIVITLGTSFFAGLDTHNKAWPLLLRCVPYLILAGCLAVSYRRTWIAAALLGLAALAGWGLVGVGAWTAM